MYTLAFLLFSCAHSAVAQQLGDNGISELKTVAATLKIGKTRKPR
jgi:hypothetical protein